MNSYDTIIVSGGNIQDDFAFAFFEEQEILGESGQLLSGNSREKTERQKKCLVIAADSGMNFFARQKLVPDLAIGDFDSASKSTMEYLRQHGEIKVYPLKPEKDDTDTQAALRLAAENGASHVLLLGGTGTRMDHVIANMGLLLFGKKLGLCVTIADAWNRIRLIPSGFAITKEEAFGTYVSFFALGGEVRGLTLKGFYYPLASHCLTMAEAGLTVSNEIVDHTARIFYESGELMMIESRD